MPARKGPRPHQSVGAPPVPLTAALQLTDSVAVPMRSLHSKQMSNRTFPFSSTVKVAAKSGTDWLSDRNSCALASGTIETAYFSPFGITASQTSHERSPLFSISASPYHNARPRHHHTPPGGPEPQGAENGCHPGDRARPRFPDLTGTTDLHVIRLISGRVRIA
jgi:hypothetical protein